MQAKLQAAAPSESVPYELQTGAHSILQDGRITLE